ADVAARVRRREVLQREILGDIDLAGLRIDGDREGRRVVVVVLVEGIEMARHTVFRQVVVGVDAADDQAVLFKEIDFFAFGRVKARPGAVAARQMQRIDSRVGIRDAVVIAVLRAIGAEIGENVDEGALPLRIADRAVVIADIRVVALVDDAREQRKYAVRSAVERDVRRAGDVSRGRLRVLRGVRAAGRLVVRDGAGAGGDTQGRAVIFELDLAGNVGRLRGRGAVIIGDGDGGVDGAFLERNELVDVVADVGAVVMQRDPLGDGHLPGHRVDRDREGSRIV